MPSRLSIALPISCHRVSGIRLEITLKHSVPLSLVVMNELILDPTNGLSQCRDDKITPWLGLRLPFELFKALINPCLPQTNLIHFLTLICNNSHHA